MRCLAQPIGRQSNREDGCTGRFWEGRFKSQPLLDESVVAGCLAYVDLNPIRAKIAKTPESSRFTSVYERIQGQKQPLPASRSSQPRHQASAQGCGTASVPGVRSRNSASAPGSEARRGAWLSPVELARDHESEAQPVPTGRASNRGCLPMSLKDYLRLLDWTGRQLRRDKRGAIRADVGPILERLKISGEGWMDLVKDFSRLFRRAAGTPASLAREADRRQRRWLQGVSGSRQVF